MITVVVGRRWDCHYVVEDDLAVRPRHCVFYGEPGAIYVRPVTDAVVYLNGVQVVDAAQVFEGDAVQVGNTLLHIPAKAGARTPPPRPTHPPTTSPSWSAAPPTTASAADTTYLIFRDRP